jgi:hypothetical protein
MPVSGRPMLVWSKSRMHAPPSRRLSSTCTSVADDCSAAFTWEFEDRSIVLCRRVMPESPPERLDPVVVGRTAALVGSDGNHDMSWM